MYQNLAVNEQILVNPVVSFEKAYGCKVTVDRFIVDECFQKIYESEKRDFMMAGATFPGGYNISHFKMAGIICFWLRKLKPFRTDGDSANNRLVNETIAFLTGYFFVYGDEKKDARQPEITAGFFHDYIKSLRYNSHSPNSSAFVFESLCMHKPALPTS